MADLSVAQQRVLREIAQALGGLVAQGSTRDAVAQRLEAAQLVRLEEVRDGACRVWVWHLTDAGRSVYERMEAGRG